MCNFGKLFLLPLLAITACGGGGSGNGSSAGVNSGGLRIFVTESSHHGDFLNDPNLDGENAIEKLDDFCGKDGFKPGGGTFKALVVDGSNRDALNLIDWVLLPNTTYYRADGVTVIGTTNSVAIFDVYFGELENSIVESAFVTGRYAYVVTGISDVANFSTASEDSSCLGFSSASSSIEPDFGLGSSTVEHAFSEANILSDCSFRHYYYCVEQP